MLDGIANAIECNELSAREFLPVARLATDSAAAIRARPQTLPLRAGDVVVCILRSGTRSLRVTRGCRSVWFRKATSALDVTRIDDRTLTMFIHAWLTELCIPPGLSVRHLAREELPSEGMWDFQLVAAS